jgi:hypothetical protein
MVNEPVRHGKVWKPTRYPVRAIKNPAVSGRAIGYAGRFDVQYLATIGAADQLM